MLQAMDGRDNESERYRLLYDLGCAFSARLDLDELIATVVERCRAVLGAGGVSILLLDSESGELYFPYVAESDPEVARRLASMRFPADRGVAGSVLAEGKARRVSDARAEPAFYDEIDAATGMQTDQILAAPLQSRHGPIGVLEVINPVDGGCFDDDDLAFLEALAGSVAVALDNARMHGELRKREKHLRSQVGVLRRDLARRKNFGRLVGGGPAMREVFRLMESAAASPIAVLVQGETGTGKELVARAIHESGDRADGPFVAVNIAALSAELLESELFGHVRGAFTGALRDRIGLFEAAGGGTLLLDEVGELPAAMQVRLLRVLQEGEVTPVGSNVTRQVDIRVIAATNSDLGVAMKEGRFREDLYYRLAAFPLTLPALRERREDLPLLIDHFLAASAKTHGKRVAGLEPAAFALLDTYDWPGNVRELENEIDRAVALSVDGSVIQARTLSPKLRESPRATGAARREPRPEPVVPAGGPESSAVSSSGDSASLSASSSFDCGAGSGARTGAGTAVSLRTARARFEAGFI